MDVSLAGRRLLVTGGAGFIGSAFVAAALREDAARVAVLDALTYAGNLDNLDPVARDRRMTFTHGDIADAALVQALLEDVRPDAVVNFAAASHVDNSIADPEVFVRTNVVGTLRLLEAVHGWWRAAGANAFRFVQVSTDEVYGPLEAPHRAAEDAPLRPSSPYAASKVGGDALVHAWHTTYGLPTLTTLGANTYGPRQFPEKLLSSFIRNALAGHDLPLYGDGRHVREWIHVDDHVRGILAVLTHGRLGDRYNLAAAEHRTNLDIVAELCDVLDELRPEATPHARLVRHVADRPGHDRRYALDGAKVAGLGWRPGLRLREGLRDTVRWYIDNSEWLARVASGTYRSRQHLEAS